MVITNHERVGKMLELLCAGLQPFVERELKNSFKGAWIKEVGRVVREPQLQIDATGKPQWDVAAILIVMWKFWNDVFRLPLGHAERSMVSELRDARNRWAHQRPFPRMTPTGPYTVRHGCFLPSQRPKKPMPSRR